MEQTAAEIGIGFCAFLHGQKYHFKARHQPDQSEGFADELHRFETERAQNWAFQ